MAQAKDYTGRLVGSKRILGRASELCNKHHKWAWRCEQCGHEGSPATFSNLSHQARAGQVGCNSCKAPRLRPIPVGTQVNNLVVIGPCKKGERNPGGASKRLVPCRCVECGEEGWWQKSNFLGGVSNCNCHREVQGGLSNTRVGILWSHARRRARDQGVPFTITHDDIVVPDRCPVLGIELSVNEGGTFHDASPTLDKFIPALGYVPGNVAVISWRANRLKGDGSLEEIEAVAAWMRAQKRGQP